MTANDYTYKKTMSHISSINRVNDCFSEHYIPNIGKGLQYISLLGTNVQFLTKLSLKSLQICPYGNERAESQVSL